MQKKTSELVNHRRTHRRIKSAGSIVKKQPGNERRNVGGVGCDKNDAETAPNIYEKFIWPRLGRFECHQVSTQQSPHDPQSCKDIRIIKWMVSVAL